MNETSDSVSKAVGPGSVLAPVAARCPLALGVREVAAAPRSRA
ncbi:hypothetical protein ACTD5D_10995 [Nocardia takedensis]|nr:hypothetical protein [Nocardia takedensis]